MVHPRDVCAFSVLRGSLLRYALRVDVERNPIQTSLGLSPLIFSSLFLENASRV